MDEETESKPSMSPMAKENELQQAQQAIVTAKAGVIVDQMTADAAGGFRELLREKLKFIEEMKQKALKPLRTSEQEIRGWFREIEASLQEAITILDLKIREYVLQAAENNRKQLAAAAAAHAEGNDAEARALMLSGQAEGRKKSPTGTNVREIWEAECTDPNAVPRDWCIPDDARIKALARATPANGTPPNIPGYSFTKGVEVRGRGRPRKTTKPKVVEVAS